MKLKVTNEQALKMRSALVNADLNGAKWGENVRATVLNWMYTLKVDVGVKDEEYVKILTKEFLKLKGIQGENIPAQKQEEFNKFCKADIKYKEFLEKEVELKDIDTLSLSQLNDSDVIITLLDPLFVVLITK